VQNDNLTPLRITFVKIYMTDVVTQNTTEELVDQGNYKTLQYRAFRAIIWRRLSFVKSMDIEKASCA